MLKFKTFLLLKEDNNSKSDRLGKLHENLVHRGLGDWPDDESRQEHDNLKAQCAPGEYEDAVVRANHAVAHIKKYIHRGRKVARVERTARPGQTGEHQRDNASDLIIHYADGSKHGISLKSGIKKGSTPPISSGGVGTLEGYTGVKSKEHYDSSMDELHEKFPHTKGMTQSQLNNEIKTNNKVKVHTKKIGAANLEKIMAAHHEAVKQMKPSELSTFLRRDVLRANPTKIPVTRVTTTGGVKGVQTEHSGQDKFDHILKDAENITSRRVGKSIIFSHPKHGDFARCRLKYMSRFGSSIKFSGEEIKPKKR